MSSLSYAGIWSCKGKLKMDGKSIPLKFTLSAFMNNPSGNVPMIMRGELRKKWWVARPFKYLGEGHFNYGHFTFISEDISELPQYERYISVSLNQELAEQKTTLALTQIEGPLWSISNAGNMSCSRL